MKVSNLPPPAPPPVPPPPPPPDNAKIKHIFVLVMENRSFDHLLGFSGITGTDTQTGQTTAIEGLTQAGQKGQYYNDYTVPIDRPELSVVGTGVVAHTSPTEPDASSKLKVSNLPPPPPPPPPTAVTTRYPVTPTAGDTIYNPHDVQHQFLDVMRQLCGQWQALDPLNGDAYPTVADAPNTGFAADYAENSDKTNPGEPMRGFAPENLLILNALAREFVLCDHWFCSMAGPTEPNRMFVHAASSGVWDDSPSTEDYISIFLGKAIEPITGSDVGISFESGTIFDALRRENRPFRIYTGDNFPQVGLLAGISLYSDIDDFADFAGDVGDPSYDAAYTFIEPAYGTIPQQLGRSFFNNSQHPANSVVLGEQLIKSVYEAISSSPLWNQSMLIITWDEHGGFFDHVKPPPAKPTGSKGGMHGFMFDQYGPRVPAVVISPWCPQNRIEHRQLEHAYIPATIEQVFGFRSITIRDAGITGLQTLATLDAPRPVTLVLPEPVAAPPPFGPAPGGQVEAGLTTSAGGGSQVSGVTTSAGIDTRPLAATEVQLAAPAPVAQAKTVELSVSATAVGPAQTVQSVGSLSATQTQAAASAPLNLNDPWLASTLAVAMKAHIEATPANATSIQARVAGLKTVGDLAQYYDELTPIVSNARVLARQQKVAARKQLAPQQP